MTKETKQEETKQKETITLFVEDYETIIDAVDTYELDDELWYEDIHHCISDGLYGHAGIQLMRMQRKIDAQEVIEKIQLERGKINENNKEKEERTITTIAKEFLSGKEKTN